MACIDGLNAAEFFLALPLAALALGSLVPAEKRHIKQCPVSRLSMEPKGTPPPVR